MMLVWYIVWSLISLPFIKSSQDYFHKRQNKQPRAAKGWQEPGLWRPIWIMDREFTETDQGDKSSKDRIYFRLKSDRSVKLLNKSKRPLLEIFKKAESEGENQKKKLFTNPEEPEEPEDDETTSKLKKIKKKDNIDKVSQIVDGTWWMQDEAPLKQAKVKIEIRDEKTGGKIRHDTRCNWGKMDYYAALFRKGTILKFKGSKTRSGIPLGTYPAGTFIIRSSVHRPIVSKDFLAFQ